MNVLIVDDDRGILDFLNAHLPAHGFRADTAADGKAGLLSACTNDHDLIILDLNLPDISGELFVQRLREREHTPPILMLTVVPDAETKARLLNAGADDYLEKPFSLDELVARMRALLRRGQAAVLDVLAVDDIVLDAQRQTVRRGERDIALTRTEFALLEQLFRNRGATVSKTKLIERIWGTTDGRLSRTLDTHIANVRKKLGDPEVIHTMHRRGYRVE